MFNNTTGNHYVTTTDIGKLNRFKYNQGTDFSFPIKDTAQRHTIIKVNVIFKQRAHQSLLNDFARESKSGELLFPDKPADLMFELAVFGRTAEEKDFAPECPKFTESKFSGFQNFK
mgnify:CR=1 FL=1